MKAILILSVLVISSFALTAEFTEFSPLWSSWKDYHGKTYSAGEDQARFSIFVENFQKIRKFNAESDSVKLALNHFADLTATEWKNLHTGCRFPRDNTNTAKASLRRSYNVPDSVDWRTKGAVTPVKDQGQCGSCWTFSATGTLEGFNAINTGKLVSFSEQQIVDCASSAGYGCQGGWEDKAIQYAADNGIEAESDYPYTARDGTCKFDKTKAVKVNKGVTMVTPKSVEALKEAIATMPTTIAIQADQSVFQFYSKGVIKSGCGASLNHAVLAVGYGTIDGTDAFIVKNSWGTSWGDKGYVYLAADAKPNAGDGVCGILAEPAIPN